MTDLDTLRAAELNAFKKVEAWTAHLKANQWDEFNADTDAYAVAVEARVLAELDDIGPMVRVDGPGQVFGPILNDDPARSSHTPVVETEAK